MDEINKVSENKNKFFTSEFVPTITYPENQSTNVDDLNGNAVIYHNKKNTNYFLEDEEIEEDLNNSQITEVSD